MQVVVLMGGRGERLTALGSGLPKAMVGVCGKPFFYYQLQLMKPYGLNKFLFCVGHKAEAISSYFKDGRRFGVQIKYSQDGNNLLGTAGALKKASRFLEDDFITIYGDTYIDLDYAELIYMYESSRAEKRIKSMMVVFKNNNKFDKSNVIFEGGRVLKYDKAVSSPGMRHIDYGISFMNKQILKEIPGGRFSDLADVYKKLAAEGQISGYEVRNRFYEIGRPSSQEEFKKFIYCRKALPKKAIFLDRDGTLNRMNFNRKTGQLDSPLRPEEVKLIPNTVKALRILKSLGYLLIVVTNQPAAAKGKTTMGRLYQVNNRLKDILLKNKIQLDDSLICAHYPPPVPFTEERFLVRKCGCRKPKAGLIHAAIKKFSIDTSRSFMVGDSYTDVLAGNSARLKTAFLGRLKCEDRKFLKTRKPDYVFNSLYCFAVELKRIKNYG